MNATKEGGAAPTQSQIHTLHRDKFNKRVQSLPQELFDEIYKLTFTSDANTRYMDTGKYATPSILQVDRKSRTMAAKSYYKNTIFAFTTAERNFVRIKRVQYHGEKWLGSLPPDHLKAVRGVKLDLPNDCLHPRRAAALYFGLHLGSNLPFRYRDLRLEIRERAGAMAIVVRTRWITD